jgi:hypothetical protein
VLLHLKVSDALKSGADYTHVSTCCQPIFTSVKRGQLPGLACINAIDEHQAVCIAAN